ncbi:GumC family protein [Sphingomonas psychrotolerans]|uniref:GumC family protein n=1 Tax=Sphingomonas psychrotolerans TaxID=1327635 RepID=UPI0013053C9E|nr:polysaccharide biosynthesis tyrosine autokinase [Sphingomonas psychrotolerans]
MPVAPAASGQTGARFDTETVLNYWRTVLKWRWLVMGTIVACVAIAVLVTLLSTPIYRSTTTVEISRNNTNPLGIAGVEQNSFALDQEFYQTQYGLLGSRGLAERVVRTLGLARNDKFLDETAVPETAQRDARSRQRENQAREDAAIGRVQANLTIEPIRGSSLVRIHFNNPDPDLAARVANTIGEAFIQSNLDRRFQASAYARDFLESRLQQVRAKLEKSERDLVAYASQQGIITIDDKGTGSASSASGTSDRSIVAADLTALNSELAVATGNRIAAESKLTSVRSAPLTRPEVLANTAISELMRNRANLSAEYSRGLETFKPDYPEMMSLRSQIGELDKQLRATAEQLTRSVSVEYQSALKRENLLKARVEMLKASVLDLRSRSIQYAIYQREIDTNRALYDGLLQRYKEIGVAGGIGTNNVSVVDQAQITKSPYRPRPIFNVLVGLLVGTALGIGLAFGLDQLDSSVIAPQEYEQKIGIPLLGSVPLASGSVLDELADKKSAVSEAYYSLLTNLQFTTNGGAPKTLLVTSSRASEGKSTTALSIARNLAHLGAATILVDADMRKPSVHRSLQLPNNAGLSNLLSNDKEVADVIQDSGVPGLMVVTSGPLPPSPAELLYGDHMKQVLQKLLERATYVVIDGPPVLGLADAPLIANSTEGTVFVIEAGSTRVAMARQALRRLQDANGHVVGGALTKFNVKKAGYGYGYSYEQAYTYGGDTDRAEKA